MAEYWRVSPKVWYQPWSDDARLLALYLLTCRHRELEGLYHLPKAYIAADLGWSAERLAEPFAELLADGFVEYDDNASVVLLPHALKYQRPENPNQAKHALRMIDDLPDTPLLAGLLRAAERHAEPFAERLRERFAERLGKPPAPAPPPAPSPPKVVTPPLREAEKPRKKSRDTKALPDVDVAICGAVSKIVGRGRIDDKPDHLFCDGSDLNVTCREYLATIDAMVDEYLGDLSAERREAARAECRRRAFASIAAIHQAKPIKNLPAYLTAAAGNATCLGDLVGDDFVTELRQKPKKRRASELRHVSEVLT